MSNRAKSRLEDLTSCFATLGEGDSADSENASNLLGQFRLGDSRVPILSQRSPWWPNCRQGLGSKWSRNECARPPLSCSAEQKKWGKMQFQRLEVANDVDNKHAQFEDVSRRNMCAIPLRHMQRRTLSKLHCGEVVTSGKTLKQNSGTERRHLFFQKKKKPLEESK